MRYFHHVADMLLGVSFAVALFLGWQAWSTRAVVRSIKITSASFDSGVLAFSGEMRKRPCALADHPDRSVQWLRADRIPPSWVIAEYGDQERQADYSRPTISPIINWRIRSVDLADPLDLDTEIQGWARHRCGDHHVGPALFFSMTPREVLAEVKSR